VHVRCAAVKTRELVSAALEGASAELGLLPVFIRVVALAPIDTAADLFAAVVLASRDRLDLAFGMCIGSAIQIALVVAPNLVPVSWPADRPLKLVLYSPLDVFAIACVALGSLGAGRRTSGCRCYRGAMNLMVPRLPAARHN
jgi:calcium/proton exchanger cax